MEYRHGKANQLLACTLPLVMVMVMVVADPIVTQSADGYINSVEQQVALNTQRIQQVKEELETHIKSQTDSKLVERLTVLETVYEVVGKRLDEINWWMRAIAFALIAGLLDRVFGILPEKGARRRRNTREESEQATSDD